MRSAPLSRAARAAWAAPVLLLVLAACGGQAGQGAAGSGGGSGSTSGVSSTTSPAPLRRLDEKTFLPTVKAAVERQKSVHVSLRASGDVPAVKAEADVALRGKRPDVALTMSGGMFGSGDVEVRVVSGTVYVSAPPMTPKGKFLEIRPGEGFSPFGGPGQHMDGVDPRHSFDGWRSGLRRVAYVGEESLHGKQVQHYRVTVDLRAGHKDLSQMPMSPMMGRVPRVVTYDVWLDQGALPVRVQLRSVRHTSFVVDLSRWGAPVTVSRPPAQQIVEYPAHPGPGPRA